MSIRAWYDVCCDAPDCLCWVECGPNKRAARESALAAGWAVSPRPVNRAFLWFCPAHVALIEGRA